LTALIASTASLPAVAGAIEPPTEVTAADVPDDGGDAIEISWIKSVSETVTGYEILRVDGAGDRHLAGETEADEASFTDESSDDNPVERDVAYSYVVRAIGSDNTSAESEPSPEVVAAASWIDSSRAVSLGAVLLFAAMFFFLVLRGKRGATLYVRPIKAVDALDDAVGRAAEMGRPILYSPGLSGVSDPATVASLSILSRVARRAARLHTPIKVPNYGPLTWPVAQNVVREAFTAAGRPEEYNPDDVSYLTSRFLTYAAAVAGIMIRERTASNFLIGHFFSEALILAETGVSTGALQIGGTDSVTQLPFIITTCDHTMIGEEMFAAAALVGGDPVSRSTIKAQDWFKALAMVAMLAALLAGVVGMFGLSDAKELGDTLADFIKGS
ncbi:MAG: hypothetical protein JRF63_13705, partial [Deltaproteobacteria bacterium]|nr:hypothetical protein [Deltaproteobacteria bacterium]